MGDKSRVPQTRLTTRLSPRQEHQQVCELWDLDTFSTTQETCCVGKTAIAPIP